jgi:hypothetical protein
MLISSAHVDSCIFHKEWNLVPETALKEDRKRLLFVLQFSLRRTAGYMSLNDKPGFLATLTTTGYKIHFYETGTGYVYLLLTHTSLQNL